MFTQRHAEAIAKKLGCTYREASAHKHAELFIAGKLIASFGIRRASKEVPHNHIPRSLYIKQSECRELYDCTMSKDTYLEILRQKGQISTQT
jgi:hypothetical protein